MIWHLLGAGAIGQLFATRLIDAGVSVRILFRQPCDYYQLHLLEGKGKRSYLLQGDSIDTEEPITHLLVCTKAPDTLKALLTHQYRICSKAHILLLQNGMGQHEAVQALFPNANIWAGITTAGAWRSDPFTLHCVSQGTTEIGRLNANNQGLPDEWNKLSPQPIAATNIHLSLWRKLAINCAINPLTAVHQCLNGELVENPVFFEQMQQVCDEVELVTNALDLPLFESTLIKNATLVANLTAKNRSSMLTDVLSSRPTEIGFITGYLCNQADLLGISLPFNQALLQQVDQQSDQHVS